MSLFKCADCRQMISDRAVSYPKCGCPVNEYTIRESNLITAQEAQQKKQMIRRNASEETSKMANRYSNKNNLFHNYYVIEYTNENEFRKKERTIKKYNMLAYKKLLFEIYPALRNGTFQGVVIYKNNEEAITKYECKLPSPKEFEKVYEPLVLHYTVYENQKIVMLNNLTPEEILTEGAQKELATYKGVPISKKHAEKDMFKINLLNMISRD